MKIQNSKPNVSSFRRALPYVAGIPVVALAIWGFQRQVMPIETVQVSRPAEVSTKVLETAGVDLGHAHQSGKKDRGCACSDCAADSATLAQKISQIPVATQPDVEALLKKFRKGERLVKTDAFDSLRTAVIGKSVTFQAGGIEWKGILDSKVDQSGVFQAGVTLDDELGRFVLSLRPDQKILATIFFTGENQVLTTRGFPVNGAWTMEASVYESVSCQPKGAVYTLPQVNAKGARAESSSVRQEFASSVIVPSLNSNPQSTYVLYVDFDGEVVNSPHWGGVIDAPPLDQAQSKAFITEVWKRAAEDFAPFDLNVTTDRAVYDAADPAKRVMGVVTSNNAAAPGAGGVAMLGSFGQEVPFWIFNDEEGTCSDTVSHEGGHTMGLEHDGTTDGVEYFYGQGTGAVSWAPIMGAYFAEGAVGLPRYDEEVSSWSKGEYPKANNKEDDLNIITSTNGFGYRADDVPNTRLAAKQIDVVDGSFADGGIIERNDDSDWYQFATRGGSLRMQISALRVQGADTRRGANLGISATLYNAAGKQLQVSNLLNSLDSSFNLTLAPGVYYVKVEGAAKGTVSTSFTKYASLGQYFITGTVPLVELIAISPLSNKFTQKGGTGGFNVSSALSWTWSCDSSWVESVELKTQSGNQYFEYVVKENTGYANRTAMIVLTSGTHQYSHSVIQEARVPDDHGDVIASATSVETQSVTDGRINFAGDVDVFKIEVTESGFLTVGSDGVSNTYGRLMDKDGVVLASNDDGNKANFHMVYPVVPGIYYVEVSLTGTFDLAGGVYQFHSSFTPSNAITIDPASRVADASAGDYGFDLTSNTDWTWSVWSFDGTNWVPGCAWLTSAEAADQSQSQRFSYHVDENTTTEVRKAQIRVRRVGAVVDDVVHAVTQNAPGMDDFGNDIANATQVALNGSIDGVINSEGDVDVFKVVLTTIGELTAGTTGAFDTFGSLLDSQGNPLASNDDLSDLNFGLTKSLMPGTYYIQVRHFQSTDVGAYRLFVGFRSPSLVYLRYKVDRNFGSISGMTTQTLKPGGNGRMVTAVAKSGYVFTGWSDGVATASRTDMRVLADLTVTAQFSRILVVEKEGAGPLVDNQATRVDFGSVSVGQPATVNFVVKNIGLKDLTKINVTRYGANASDWTIAPLAKTTLKPNESLIVTATLNSSTIGTKFCTLTINATGNPLPFRINVVGTVGGIITGSKAEGSQEGSAGSSSAVQGAGVSAAGAAGVGSSSSQPSGIPSAWADVSPEGGIQHFFSQAAGEKQIPDFWISGDGVTWVRTTVLALWEVGASADRKDFEVLLSAMDLDATRVVISNEPPKNENP